MNIKYSSQCWNVGQGLFYSGSINNYQVVYDCGSKNKAARVNAINNYCSINQNKIDLLILSHFHDDHINGIEELLSKKKVHTVILPYLSPIERLYLSCKRGYTNYSMLFDPISFFRERDVTQIILITPGSGESDEPVAPPLNNNNNNNNNNQDDPLDLGAMIEDELVRGQLEQNEIYKEMLDTGRLFVFTHKRAIFLSHMWMFRFFTIAMDLSSFSNFAMCVDDLADENNVRNMAKLIQNKEVRNRLKNCYELCKTDFNDTSLSVYHGLVKETGTILQITHNGIEQVLGWYYGKYTVSCSCPLSGLSGHLLTGDLNLSLAENFKEFTVHFKHQLNYVYMCLLPHHGALKNWNNDLMGMVPNCEQWVASSGFSNGYSHPSLQIVETLLINNRMFSRCDEFVSMNLNGET